MTDYAGIFGGGGGGGVFLRSENDDGKIGRPSGKINK